MAMKVYTKRKGIVNGLKDVAILQRTLNRLRNFSLIPRGIYRFNTFAESEQWMIQKIAATHARRK